MKRHLLISLALFATAIVVACEDATLVEPQSAVEVLVPTVDIDATFQAAISATALTTDSLNTATADAISETAAAQPTPTETATSTETKVIESPTPTSEPTSTSTPTEVAVVVPVPNATSVPKSAETPVPTATLVPPSPTPIPAPDLYVDNPSYALGTPNLDNSTEVTIRVGYGNSGTESASLFAVTSSGTYVGSRRFNEAIMPGARDEVTFTTVLPPGKHHLTLSISESGVISEEVTRLENNSVQLLIEVPVPNQVTVFRLYLSDDDFSDETWAKLENEYADVNISSNQWLRFAQLLTDLDTDARSDAMSFVSSRSLSDSTIELAERVAGYHHDLQVATFDRDDFTGSDANFFALDAFELYQQSERIRRVWKYDGRPVIENQAILRFLEQFDPYDYQYCELENIFTDSGMLFESALCDPSQPNKIENSDAGIIRYATTTEHREMLRRMEEAYHISRDTAGVYAMSPLERDDEGLKFLLHREYSPRATAHMAFTKNNFSGLIDIPNRIPAPTDPEVCIPSPYCIEGPLRWHSSNGQLMTTVEFVTAVINDPGWGGTEGAPMDQVHAERIFNYFRYNTRHIVPFGSERVGVTFGLRYPNDDNSLPAGVMTPNLFLMVGYGDSGNAAGALAAMWRLAGLPAIDFATVNSHGMSKVRIQGVWKNIPGNEVYNFNRKQDRVETFFLSEEEFEIYDSR